MCACLVTQSCPTVCDPMGWTVTHQAPLSMGFFSGKNTGVDCHFFLQGIFLIQGLNPCLLHWQANSLPVSHLVTLGPKLPTESYIIFLLVMCLPVLSVSDILLCTHFGCFRTHWSLRMWLWTSPGRSRFHWIPHRGNSTEMWCWKTSETLSQ